MTFTDPSGSQARHDLSRIRGQRTNLTKFIGLAGLGPPRVLVAPAFRFTPRFLIGLVRAPIGLNRAMG